MVSITINITDSQLQKLQDLARLDGIPLEVLVSASIEDWLSSPKIEFTEAANYVLKKNAELYRCLA
ncbi:MAG: DNA-binding protein [Nostoc sp. ChiSLP01]|nr:DNA-binding protein [Nostoc sp. CmiSLP01]MDZ8282509.1 DNA-binding protein [Nostoc sp. ChiSLP01]